MDDAGELAESEGHRPTPHAIERTHHASPRTLVFDPTPFICRVFCWLTFVLWDLANGSETKRYGRGRDSNDFTANKKMMIGPMSCVRRQIPTETSSRPGPAAVPLVPVLRRVYSSLPTHCCHSPRCLWCPGSGRRSPGFQTLLAAWVAGPLQYVLR